ncbi:MAG TPA: TIR domain-containing protein [Pseudonocardiaceae bacterium]|nr:TIR domain-containing protein [Pseudonocardiaceae bacterium]
MFINYRGEDSHGYGALLYTELTRQFGKEQVFLDAESIPAGADFERELLDRVRSSRVLLAVMGRRWLTADPNGRRRIDDPDDWIRRELAEAFTSGVRVIPILTDDAELPCAAELPADIAALSRCQYRHLRRREPTTDLARIVTELTSLDPNLAANPPGQRTPVDEQLHLLATASWNQWTAAANDRRLLHPAPLPIRWCRSTAPVAGPVSAYPRFDSLPGLTAVNGLVEGDQDALHRVYGGLPSGRLLLIGKAGSGKSAAAILLLLDALRYRKQATPNDQAQIPVPVLFTLHGWQPDNGESVTDWLAGKLAETYPIFSGRAGRRTATDLLTAGHIAVFLDGLDEIPESIRPGVLTALADAPFRLVLLARTEEAVTAANHGPLAGAVALELQSVQPTDAAAYLLQPLVDPPPAPWQAISDHLAEVALDTPLALSLLRDVYGPTDPVDELLDTARFPTAADVENHLLDHAITAAYTPRPGHPTPRYTVATAHRTLRYLATQLTEHGTADLAWWHVPTWIPQRSRVVGDAVVVVLVNELVIGLPLGLVFGLGLGLLAGLVFGLMSFFGFLAGQWRGVPIMPRQMTGRLTCRITEHSLTYGLASGLTVGLLAGLPAGLVFGLSAGLVSGFSVGLASGLAGVALSGLVRHTEVDESSLGPADVWRHDRNAGTVSMFAVGLAVGLLVVLAVGLVPGLASGLASRPSVVISVVLLVGLVLGLGSTVTAKRVGTAVSSPGSAAGETAMTLVQLAIRHKIPLRLIPFLEDARSRHLLRTVGPVYQFRHATLQDRLAATVRRSCP